MPWKFKKYRCEWQVQNGTVDQYGLNFVAYATYPFSSYEEAVAFRPQVADPHKHVGERWIPKDATHSYVESKIVYREVCVERTEE